MNRNSNLLLSSLFILFIFSAGIYLLVAPDNKISEIENRTLTQKPELTPESIRTGSFMKNFESYITDQFPLRDSWLKSYVSFQLRTGRIYVNDYHITEKDWIMPRPEFTYPFKEMDTAAENINEFGEYLEIKGAELYYFSVPHKINVLEFLYPNYIEKGNYNEKKDYLLGKLNENNVKSVDITDEFLQSFSNEELMQMYFKTDHHWNINGALKAYKIINHTLMRNSEYVPAKEKDSSKYELNCLHSVDFKGSYNRQLYEMIADDEENTCISFAKSFKDYQVSLGEESVKPFELFGSAFQSENNNPVDYGGLFTEDMREITITNPKKHSEGNKLLVIKDSYANPMIYHLAEDFYKTVIYDPRHNQDRTIYEYIEKHDFDVVSIIYNSTHIRGENYNFANYPK